MILTKMGPCLRLLNFKGIQDYKTVCISGDLQGEQT